jgi:hypothetical protein
MRTSPQAFVAAAALTAPFSTTYTPEGGASYDILGWEPDTEGTYPVVLFLGASVPHELNVQFANVAQTWFEYQGGYGSLTSTCGFIYAIVVRALPK